MFHYVTNYEFLKRAKASCVTLLKELVIELKENYNMTTQFFLVGSSKRNMVTQNANEPIDFDYNLNIISCDDWYDCRTIKENVRKAFNKVLNRYGGHDVSDSTIPLTTGLMHFGDYPEIDFYIDLCIVTKNSSGNWERLKHEKIGYIFQDHVYNWIPAPCSKRHEEKAKAIKAVPGAWEEVRKRYLKIKNNYLTNNNYDHPSFVCYIQAVHDVHNTLKQKGIL